MKELRIEHKKNKHLIFGKTNPIRADEGASRPLHLGAPGGALRGRGLQGEWDHSLPRRLSAMSGSGHTSTLDLRSSCSQCSMFVRHALKTAPRGTKPVSR